MVRYAHLFAPSSNCPTMSVGTEVSSEDVVSKPVATFPHTGAMQMVGFGTRKTTSAHISTVPKTHNTCPSPTTMADNL